MTRTAKIVAITLAALLCLFLIVSCNQRTIYAQPAIVAQPGYAQGPVVVQQAPVYVGGGHDGFFSGMLAGHLMSGGFGSNHTTTIVHAPTTPVPAYRAPPVPTYRPAPLNTVPRPSYTTNSRGVSTTTSRSGGISVRSSSRR